jgi:small subunit ribosomal protein S6
MKNYEITCVIDPNITEEELPALLEKISGQVVTMGGEIISVDNWGKRRLAYEINGKNEGIYVTMHFSAGPDVAKELGRIARISDKILRNLVIKNN